jgi:serine/threonine protein phosphatase PrpC
LGYVSQRGYYPDSSDKDNQDAFFVDTAFMDDKEVQYYGVFDGHGGEGDRYSQFARDAVQRRLKDRIKAKEQLDVAYPKRVSPTPT